MDEMLPDMMFQCLQYGSIVISIFVVIAIFLPWYVFSFINYVSKHSLHRFILAFVPISVVFVLLGVYYNKSARELKRLDSISRSPINAHLYSTLQGN